MQEVSSAYLYVLRYEPIYGHVTVDAYDSDEGWETNAANRYTQAIFDTAIFGVNNLTALPYYLGSGYYRSITETVAVDWKAGDGACREATSTRSSSLGSPLPGVYLLSMSFVMRGYGDDDKVRSRATFSLSSSSSTYNTGADFSPTGSPTTNAFLLSDHVLSKQEMFVNIPASVFHAQRTYCNMVDGHYLRDVFSGATGNLCCYDNPYGADSIGVTNGIYTCTDVNGGSGVKPEWKPSAACPSGGVCTSGSPIYSCLGSSSNDCDILSNDKCELIDSCSLVTTDSYCKDVEDELCYTFNNQNDCDFNSGGMCHWYISCETLNPSGPTGKFLCGEVFDELSCENSGENCEWVEEQECDGTYDCADVDDNGLCGALPSCYSTFSDPCVGPYWSQTSQAQCAIPPYSTTMGCTWLCTSLDSATCDGDMICTNDNCDSLASPYGGSSTACHSDPDACVAYNNSGVFDEYNDGESGCFGGSYETCDVVQEVFDQTDLPSDCLNPSSLSCTGAAASICSGTASCTGALNAATNSCSYSCSYEDFCIIDYGGSSPDCESHLNSGDCNDDPYCLWDPILDDGCHVIEEACTTLLEADCMTMQLSGKACRWTGTTCVDSCKAYESSYSNPNTLESYCNNDAANEPDCTYYERCAGTPIIGGILTTSCAGASPCPTDLGCTLGACSSFSVSTCPSECDLLCTRPEWELSTINRDSSQAACECEGGVWGLPACCGDDSSEYPIRSSGFKNDGTTWCCDQSSDCVYGSACTNTGSSRAITGDTLYCANADWKECLEDIHCGATQVCTQPQGLCQYRCYPDLDHDNHGDNAAPFVLRDACIDDPASVYDESSLNDDCDDSNPAVWGAATLYIDADHDGYGSSLTAFVCPGPIGYSLISGDCDDNPVTGMNAHPGLPEVCDGLDNDCNGLVNDGLLNINGGTVCSTGAPGVCSGGTQYQYCDATVTSYTWSACLPNSPAAAETCDTLDNNCDGVVDDGCDDDRDRYADLARTCSGSFLDGNGVVRSCASNSGDCADDNPFAYPGAAEVCDGVDNNCDGLGLVDDADPLFVTTGSSPLPLSSCGVCTGYYQTCIGGVWTDDYSVVPDYVLFEGAPAPCDGLDNDCDCLTDEGTVGGNCYAFPSCVGSIDCTTLGVANCLPGCTLVKGECRDSGYLCTTDADCGAGDACDSPAARCTGMTSCSQFTIQGPAAGNDCSDYPTCTWDPVHCDTAFAGVEQCLNPALGGACSWTCGAISQEICSNRISDDIDLPVALVDCQDPDCRVPIGVTLTDEEARGSYNCLGTDQTGDVGAGNYYCGAAESDPAVGFCCESGYKPELSVVFGTWSCQEADPCYPAPPYTCGLDYSSQFSSWIDDVNCIDASAVTACCQVVAFGETDYYSDSGNIRVY